MSETSQALTTLFVISAMVFSLLALADWIGHTPQKIDVYVRFSDD